MSEQLLSRICQIEQAILHIETMMLLLVNENRNSDAMDVLTEIRDTLQQPPSGDKEDEWLDSYDLMQQFKISRSTLYRWKKNKVLVASCLGRKDMFRKSLIEKSLKAPQPS